MVLYIYCFSKKTKNSNEETQKELIKDNYKGVKITEYISKYDKSKYYIFKIIIVIFLDLLCDLAFFIFYETNKNANYHKIEHRIENDITNNLDVLMRYILSSLLLKIKIKRHHKFSFIIISITSLLILILNIIEIHFYPGEDKDEKLSWIFVIFLSIKSVLYPLEEIAAKSLFNNDYILPESLMFIRSIGINILLIIITPILYYSLDFNLNFNPKDNNISLLIFAIVLFSVTSFIKSYLTLKVIYYYSVQSVSFLIISDSIIDSFVVIIKSFSKENIEIIFAFVQMIFIIISIFVIFVYDEIIIIYKCDMDIDCNNTIITRGLKDKNRMFINDDDNEIKETVEMTQKLIPSVTLYGLE